MSVTVPPAGAPGITRLFNLGDVQGTILDVNSMHDGKSHIWGSAALIAPGIAITARHVIDEYMASGHFNGNDYTLLLSGPRRGAMMMWVVRSVTVLGFTDLAILSLDLRSRLPRDRTIRVLELTARLPEVGENVMAVGFRADEHSFVNGPNYSSVSGVTLNSIGRVLGVHQNGRDRVMAPFPCVELELRAPGGLSGGPVFDREGRVFGLLSSSLGSETYSIAAMVWPSLGAKFTPAWPKGLYANPTDLMKVCEPGRGGFLRYPSHIRLHEGLDGGAKIEWRQQLFAPFG